MPGTQYVPNRRRPLSLFPDFISVNMLKMAFWFIALEAFSLGKSRGCVHKFTGHTEIVFKHWPFQSRFSFQSHWLWEGTQQGSFCQHWSKGEEDPGLPLVGLIEGRATRCLSRKGGWLPAPVPVPPRFS